MGKTKIKRLYYRIVVSSQSEKQLCYHWFTHILQHIYNDIDEKKDKLISPNAGRTIKAPNEENISHRGDPNT